MINDAEANEGNFEFCVFTDADGGYQITGLAANEYTVFEVLPEGSTNTTPLSQIVTVGDGQIVQNVNFGNKIALPPPDEVTVSPSNFDFGGIPVIHWQSETTYTKDVGPDGFNHCGADMPLAVKLVIGPFSETPGSEPVEMMMSNTSGEIWEANFGPLFPAHGTAPLIFYVDCPPDTTDFPEDISLISGEDEIQKGGNIYIDPSGTILDACTDEPLVDATVTILVEIDPLFDPGFFVPAPASTPPLIPAVNPQTTLSDGMYGWVVTAGNYKVLAEKLGYISTESDSLTIPPAVTDLNISLERLDGCPSELSLSDKAIEEFEEKIERWSEKADTLEQKAMDLLDKAAILEDNGRTERAAELTEKAQDILGRASVFRDLSDALQDILDNILT